MSPLVNTLLTNKRFIYMVPAMEKQYWPPALIGLSPGNHARHDPDVHALYPNPVRSAGWQLWQMMGGDDGSLHLSTYVSFLRANLWPRERHPKGIAVARLQADIIRRRWPNRRLVLFGRTVARAFGLGPEAPWMTWDEGIAVVPHPSGRSYWYNDPDNAARARTFLRRVASEILNWEGA